MADCRSDNKPLPDEPIQTNYWNKCSEIDGNRVSLAIHSERIIEPLRASQGLTEAYALVAFAFRVRVLPDDEMSAE